MRKWNVLVLLFWVCTMGISTAQSLPDYLPKDGLVGWWPFNGNAKDESGNGHDGVVNGASLTNDRYQLDKSAYRFDSINNTIIIKHHPSFNSLPLTISLWTKSSGDNDGATFIRKYRAGSWNGWSLGIESPLTTDGKPAMEFAYYIFPCGGIYQSYCNSVPFVNNEQLYDDKWHHYIFIADSTGGSIYKDGKLFHQQNWFFNQNPNGAPVSVTSNWPIYIGSTPDLNRFFNGSIDDIGIWNRALTPEEITILHKTDTKEFYADLISDKSTTICKGDSLTLRVKLDAPKIQMGSKGPAGGLVFYDKGTNSGGWRYLESAPENIGLYSWGCDGLNIQANSSSGFTNTNNIVNNCTDSTIAAKKCLDYSLNGVDDWYLPSQFEFSQIYKNLILNDLGNFKVGPIPSRGTLYWTSNQLTTASGSHFCLECDGNFYQYSKIYELYVRPVRRFAGPEFNDPVTYLWSTGETSSSINVKPGTETVYYVTVTNGSFSVIDSITVYPKNCCPSELTPKNNLIASWTFCENLLDVSGNGHHGKVKTGTETYTADRHGNENQALLLDGQTYIEVPHNEAFNGFPFSVSAWVKTENKDHQHVINKYSSAAWNGWSLWTQSYGSGWYLRSRTNAMISQYDDFPPFNTEENYSDNQWHLLTFTVDDSLGYIYYDGILQDTQVWRGTPGKCTSGFPIRIGFYAGDNVFFKGAVDDIAVWDRRLTDEEIKNLCDKKPSSDLTVYMDTLAVSPSQEVVMPVHVKNFNDLISAQFSLRFDPKFLKFKAIENSILNPDVADLFGLSQVADGLIGFAWSDINIQPQTLADGTALFNVRFELVPGVQGGDVTFLNIIDAPIDIEFMNKDLEVLDRYELGTGIIKILNGLSMQAIILTEDGKGVPLATVQVSGHAQMSAFTSREGRYNAVLDRNRNFTFTPDKVNDSIVTNGITVADVMRIKRHILRTNLLESPYKIIAADINSDQKVTLADVNFILALLRGELNIFPKGKLWKFVPRNHIFSDATNPFPYPASITTPSLSENDNLDFIGIKMGDVDNNYDATHTRSGRKEVGFHLNQTEGINGQTITIPVKVSGFDHVSGFQFALQWDPAVLSFRGLSEDHRNQDVILGTKDVKQGTLRVFWTESKGESIHLKDGDAIIHLSFVITGDAGDISNLTFARLKDMPVEAINDDIHSLPVVLESGKISVKRSAIADKNGVKNTVSVSPNPVLYESWISISSTLDEVVSIQVYDASGKVASESRHTVAKGNTTLPLDLPARAGMYLVRVNHSDGSLMQDVKVIRI